MKRHSIGLLAVGALCWVGYTAYANVLTLVFRWPHLVAEASGIPLSLVAYYLLNTRYVFRQRPSWRQFGGCAAVSAVGWTAYLLTTFIATDVLRWHSTIGTVLAIGSNGASNLIFQQAVTFGLLRRKDARGGRTQPVAP